MAPTQVLFCSRCGAKLMAEARFCVECGAPLPGASRTLRVAPSLGRYAPLLVVVAVVVIVGGAVVIGLRNPTVPPSLPQPSGGQRGAPAGAPPGASSGTGAMPEGHPPIAIPDDVKKTIRDMAKSADAQPDNVSLWKQLAEMQYRAGQIDPSFLPEAQSAYEHVLEREPDNADVMRSLGNVAFDREQPEKAIDQYTRYLAVKPDDQDVQTDRATMRLAAGHTQEAIADYQKILSTNPAAFQAQFNLGIAYGKGGQTTEAVAALQRARGLATDDRVRSQVDQVLARVQGGSGAMPAAGAGAAPSGGADTFHAGVEEIFRNHQIVGPKLDRFEWTGDSQVRVVLHEFPMAAIPEEIRTRFTDRISRELKQQKAAHQVTQPVQVQLVDDANGDVMQTINE